MIFYWEYWQMENTDRKINLLRHFYVVIMNLGQLRSSLFYSTIWLVEQDLLMLSLYVLKMQFCLSSKVRGVKNQQKRGHRKLKVEFSCRPTGKTIFWQDVLIVYKRSHSPWVLTFPIRKTICIKIFPKAHSVCLSSLVAVYQCVWPFIENIQTNLSKE